MKQFLVIIFSIFSIKSFAQLNSYNYNNEKNIEARNGAVVSAHALASNAGLQILKQGGNAFDAAIATQLALAVVYPGAGNLGGGGFMIAHTSNGKNIALDFRETAPSKANKDMYLDNAGNVIENLSIEGHLASGVPGSVAGIFAIYKYATLPFATLINPAITLAEKGFAVTKAQAVDFNNNKDDFVRNNKKPVAFVKNEFWKAGDTLIQTDLANTLKRIRDKGFDDFYKGKTAELIAAEMKTGKGIISLDDLKSYKVVERDPMVFPYKNYDIITMPLPSSGGIILEQLLKISNANKLASKGFQSADAVQLVVEAERRVFADRAEYMGDADFVKVPIKTLVSEEYLQNRMKDYEPNKASNSSTTKPGIINESEETTHFNVVDAKGNAVSITTTLNNYFGNKTIIAGAGFIMNNEMDDFSSKPGVPNMYGAIGNEKNAIAPYKRMLSSMTPTIVLKNNHPYIIVGTPGGTTIPTSVFQTIVNIIDFKLSPIDAVNKPKFHHQWQPDVVFVEKMFNENTKIKLKEFGYKLEDRNQIGRTELIVIDKKILDSKPLNKHSKTHRITYTKVITAIADNRGDDDAKGF